MNPNKASGPDGISPCFLKPFAPELAIPLNIIFTKSIELGQIPNEWKRARIATVFKKGNKKIANNYRPVSLTSIVAVVMEHIIRKHMVDHMARNKLFSKKQYGFMHGRSTGLQLLKVLDVWTDAIEEGYYVGCVYMDLMKAFDSRGKRSQV